MIRTMSKLLTVLFLAGASMVGRGQKSPPDRDAAPTGDWRGNSICVVRESACRDEDSLYHVFQDPEKASQLRLKADKIVDGKPVTMGTSDCSWDPQHHLLECPIPGGNALRFTVEGNEMHGTMTLANKTLWRKISLKKVGSDDR